MKRYLYIAICLLAYLPKGHAQLNVQLLHQLVSKSQSEYDKQNEAKNKQAVTSANEEVNRSEMGKLKTRYRELQSRFKTLGLVFDAAQIGLQATSIVTEIIRQQGLIFQLAGQDPLLLTLAYQTEIDLADQAYRLTRYMYALMISMGDLNQMKVSDRKMLFGYVLSELRRIEGTSRGLAANLYYANRKRIINSFNPFAEFVNQDKYLIDNILRNADILKN